MHSFQKAIKHDFIPTLIKGSTGLYYFSDLFDNKIGAA